MATNPFATWDKMLCMMLCRELVKLAMDDTHLRARIQHAKVLTRRNKYLRVKNTGPYPESIKSFWLQSLAKTCRFWSARVKTFRETVGMWFLFQSHARMRLVLTHERKLRTKKRIATLHRDSLIVLRSVAYSLIPDVVPAPMDANTNTNTKTNILVTKPLSEVVDKYSFLDMWNMIKGNKTKVVCKRLRLTFMEIHGWDWDVRVGISFTPSGANVPFRDKMISIKYICLRTDV